MFYKHWKKISLALTAFFWASCNNSTVTEPPLYGCPREGCGNQPISSSEASPESSSSEATVLSSSSSEAVSSSGTAESSSSFVLPVPAYGVEAVPCYEDSKGVKTNGEIAQKKFYCDDGVVCKETERGSYMSEYPCSPVDDGDLKGAVACPDYGVVYVTERTYDCDGVTYNEAEFRSRYFNAGIKPPSSSSTEQSFSSAKVTCAPGDSTVTYYPPSYSADIAKMNAEERAKRASVSKIDSTIKTLPSVPQCLANLRQELDMFVALYGAPVTLPKDEVCSDGTTHPTKEYQEYLKMKEEWEANKPALDAECQKIYEEKLENIQKRINKCLNPFGTDQT